MTKTAHWWSWSCDSHGLSEVSFFSRKYSRGCTETHKSSFFQYKHGRNGDHEWLRMTNAFILCDLVWKVQKSHAVNREGSIKFSWSCSCSISFHGLVMSYCHDIGLCNTPQIYIILGILENWGMKISWIFGWQIYPIPKGFVSYLPSPLPKWFWVKISN